VQIERKRAEKSEERKGKEGVSLVRRVRGDAAGRGGASPLGSPASIPLSGRWSIVWAGCLLKMDRRPGSGRESSVQTATPFLLCPFRLLFERPAAGLVLPGCPRIIRHSVVQAMGLPSMGNARG
jgi:hypothetical protein